MLVVNFEWAEENKDHERIDWKLCKVKSHTTIPKRKIAFTFVLSSPYLQITKTLPTMAFYLSHLCYDELLPSLSLECLLYLPCPTQQKGHKSKSHTSPKCHYPQRHLCWVQPCFCITKTTKFKTLHTE